MDVVHTHAHEGAMLLKRSKISSLHFPVGGSTYCCCCGSGCPSGPKPVTAHTHTHTYTHIYMHTQEEIASDQLRDALRV
jgi:hypothetical protein